MRWVNPNPQTQAHKNVIFFLTLAMWHVGIQVPQPGTEPISQQWKCSLNHWITECWGSPEIMQLSAFREFNLTSIFQLGFPGLIFRVSLILRNMEKENGIPPSIIAWKTQGQRSLEANQGLERVRYSRLSTSTSLQIITEGIMASVGIWIRSPSCRWTVRGSSTVGGTLPWSALVVTAVSLLLLTEGPHRSGSITAPAEEKFGHAPQHQPEGQGPLGPLLLPVFLSCWALGNCRGPFLRRER